MGLFALLMSLAAPGTAQAASFASTDANGCYLAVSPTAGPVGARVTVYGSTATCGTTGSDGGALMFQDEHAGVQIPDLLT